MTDALGFKAMTTALGKASASRTCGFQSELKHSCSLVPPMLGKLTTRLALCAANRRLSRQLSLWSCVSLSLDLTQNND